MAPSRTRLPLLLLAGLLAIGAPAHADYDPAAIFTTETIWTATDANFEPRDATLALRPDGTYVEAFITPGTDDVFPSRILARTGGPGAWGPVEEVTDHPADVSPRTLDVFATPDGGAVAVWVLYSLEGDVIRTATRAPEGGWSEPEDLGTGDLQIRRLLPGPDGATLLWTTADALHARSWSDGGWGPEHTSPGTMPVFRDSYAIAERASDGQVTVAIHDSDDQVLRLSQLDPGAGWSDPVLTHLKYDNCEVDVGVLDQYGTIRAIVTLCYQSLVHGYPGAVYAPNGDLHVWWNSWSGMSRVQGLYPNHQIVCDCSHGVSGGVFADGVLTPEAGVATGIAPGALLPGMPRSVDQRSFHKVWDEDGDLTMFVGGLGEHGRTINAYRDGDTFAEPIATFQAPGSSQSSRSGYVVETFTSGDDILVAYQHSAPASNLGPGGSCNTRVLYADDTLSDFLNACLDGNTTDYRAVQAADGSVAFASASVRYYRFSRLLASDPPVAAAATVTLTGPAPTYGTPGSALATVTGAGSPATGTVRLRYGATVLATAPLGPGGSATLPIGRTALPPGSRVLTVDYLGSDTVLAGSANRTVTVGKATPKPPAATVTKKPTSRKSGKVRVTVAAPTSGLATPAGQVTLTLRRGGQTQQRSRSLSGGAVTLIVPKLAKGTWKLTASYAGNAFYLARTGPTTTLKVTG